MSVLIKNFEIPKDGTYAVHIHVLNGNATLRWIDNKSFEIKPVVRCKDCIFHEVFSDNSYGCLRFKFRHNNEKDFCSFAERKQDESN